MPSTDEILYFLKYHGHAVNEKGIRINAANLNKVADGQYPEFARILGVVTPQDRKAAKAAAQILAGAQLGISYKPQKLSR